jgi:hypothetical protein
VVGGLGELAALVLFVAVFARKQWVKALGGVTVACPALAAAKLPLRAKRV